MITKKIILKSWWHEDSLSIPDQDKLILFTQELKEKVDSKYEKPKGPADLFEGDGYFFFQNKNDYDFDLNVTSDSIEVSYPNGYYNLDQMKEAFQDLVKETLEIHNSLGLQLDHYHFFIEIVFGCHISDINDGFREKLGIHTGDKFLESSLGPLSANIHYELEEAQSVIMSLIVKDFDKKEFYDYKIKVDAGKLQSNYETIKWGIERTEKNFNEIIKSKL